MKKFALILGMVGYAMAAVGNLAPYHLGKTWHYSYGMSNYDYSFSDKLNVYMKVKSVDSASEKTKIMLSVSAVGTRILGRGSLPLDTTFTQTIIDSNGYILPQSPSFLDFTPFNATRSASGPSFGSERDTVIAGMATKAIDQNTSLYNKVWAAGIGLVHAWQRDANMLPYDTRYIDFLGFEEKPVIIAGDFAPFQTDKTWHYKNEFGSGMGSTFFEVDSLDEFMKIRKVETDHGVTKVTMEVRTIGSRHKGNVTSHVDTNSISSFVDSAGIVIDVGSEKPAWLPFAPRHDLVKFDSILPFLRLYDTSIANKPARVAVEDESTPGTYSRKWVSGIGLVSLEVFPYHHDNPSYHVIKFVGFEEPPISIRESEMRRMGNARLNSIRGPWSGMPGMFFNGASVNGRIQESAGP